VRRVPVALLLAAAALAGEADRELLGAHGITPDAFGIGAHLRGLVLGEMERSRALALVRDLGSEDPLTRHEAILRLSALRAPALDAIREAAGSPDPEVRRAAARLREEWLRRVRKDVLLAALRTIADDGVRGIADEVLELAPLAAEMQLGPWVASALRATVVEEDLAALRLVAAAGSGEGRYAAVRALGAAPGAGPDEVSAWVDAADGRLRLCAALALADRGDPRCLASLLALLDAADLHVRRDAADALRAACGGGGSGYDPFGGPEARRGSIEAWRKWIGARPTDAALKHPLPVGSRHIGRTLISIYPQNRVIEVDGSGTRRFEVGGISGPWAIQGLPNGHRLVALHPRKEIVEYDAEGLEVARLQVPGHPQGFQRLENGNTLVAIAEQSRVVEMAPDGGIARDWALGGQPVDVRMLDSGNLLVCLMRPAAAVVEVNRRGRTVWSLQGLTHASTAQRLENGNTLVAETGKQRVAEFDSTGRVVWETKGLQMLYSAERLPDGNTLVADQAGVREIAPDGKERWLHKTTAFTRATRY
jgi:hypothetical protein